MQSGALRLAREVALVGEPGPLAVSPDQRYLYAGLRSTCQVTSLAIDPSTGELSFLATIDLHSDPCYMSTDRTGRFLLSSYYRAGGIAVHPIDASGVVRGPPVEQRTTHPKAHCIQTDRTNRYVFVPHVMDANRILQFRFQERVGHLIPNEPPAAIAAPGDGPRHFCYHPLQDWVYVCNEQGCSVTAYRLDVATGRLMPFQTVSTLPEAYQGKNSCAQIAIDPQGQFVYAPNRGHDSIACFSVDQTTGRLAPQGLQATEPVPRVVAVDPRGRFFFAAGLASGRLAAYRIDRRSGALVPLYTTHVGERPMWVTILEFPSSGRA